jgi:hypothetical protein
MDLHSADLDARRRRDIEQRERSHHDHALRSSPRACRRERGELNRPAVAVASVAAVTPSARSGKVARLSGATGQALDTHRR